MAAATDDIDQFLASKLGDGGNASTDQTDDIDSFLNKKLGPGASPPKPVMNEPILSAPSQRPAPMLGDISTPTLTTTTTGALPSRIPISPSGEPLLEKLERYGTALGTGIAGTSAAMGDTALDWLDTLSGNRETGPLPGMPPPLPSFRNQIMDASAHQAAQDFQQSDPQHQLDSQIVHGIGSLIPMAALGGPAASAASDLALPGVIGHSIAGAGAVGLPAALAAPEGQRLESGLKGAGAGLVLGPLSEIPNFGDSTLGWLGGEATRRGLAGAAGGGLAALEDGNQQDIIRDTLMNAAMQGGPERGAPELPGPIDMAAPSAPAAMELSPPQIPLEIPRYPKPDFPRPQPLQARSEAGSPVPAQVPPQEVIPPEPIISPPAQPSMAESPSIPLPDGVAYNGPQMMMGKKVYDTYTDQQTGSTFGVKPGESIEDALMSKRAEFQPKPTQKEGDSIGQETISPDQGGGEGRQGEAPLTPQTQAPTKSQAVENGQPPVPRALEGHQIEPQAPESKSVENPEETLSRAQKSVSPIEQKGPANAEAVRSDQGQPEIKGNVGQDGKGTRGKDLQLEAPKQSGNAEEQVAEPSPPPEKEAAPAPEPESTKTSLRKADIQRERQILGLDQVDSPAKRTWADAHAEAKKGKMKEKAIDRAYEVAAGLEEGDRLTMVEKAANAQKRNELDQTLRGLIDSRDAATDPADKSFIQGDIDGVKADIDILQRGHMSSSSETARDLGMNRSLLDDEMNVGSAISQAESKVGRKLTPAEETWHVKKTKEMEAEMAGIQNKLDDATHAQAADALNQKVRKLAPKEKRAANEEYQATYAKVKELLRAGCETN